jgi:ATP-dependent Clp protease ATP-binding subunit ClpB
VILFDEIEKAHPDVFNILLQLLDDGRLTDGQGRTVDFRNSVVIMTSNLGSSYVSAMGSSAGEDAREKVMEALRNHFRPEFLNRIDDIVIFQALSRDQIGEIVDIQMATVAKRLADRQITIQVTPAAKFWLGARGYDPAFGARPLKRLIQREVLDPLAMKVLAGELTDGENVVVDEQDGRLLFAATVREAPMVA